jgi:hypothetical protein
MINRRLTLSVGVWLVVCCLSIFVLGQGEASPVSSAMSNLTWRSIGPANMGGRVADVEGVPGNPNVVYVATGSGGIFTGRRFSTGRIRFRSGISRSSREIQT